MPCALKEFTFATLADLVLVTHVVDPVYEGVVAAVAHGKPVTAEPDHVDVSVSAKYDLYWNIYQPQNT